MKFRFKFQRNFSALVETWINFLQITRKRRIWKCLAIVIGILPARFMLEILETTHPRMNWNRLSVSTGPWRMSGWHGTHRVSRSSNTKIRGMRKMLYAIWMERKIDQLLFKKTPLQAIRIGIHDSICCLDHYWNLSSPSKGILVRHIFLKTECASFSVQICLAHPGSI